MRRRLGMLLIFASLTFMGLSAWLRLTPIVRELAEAQAKNTVTAAVSTAAAQLIAEGKLNYYDIVRLEKDGQGKVSALVSDMSRLGELKAEMTNRVIGLMSDRATTHVSVPLGNLFGRSIFSGRGPEIPISIISARSVETDFENRFETAGINQTRHQIMIVVKVELSMMMPGGTVTARLVNAVAAAETVIVGSVPDSYTYFESSEQWNEALERYDILT